jgi:4-amino-4-deoxy-L-arabinose transferase-like glycosyltransferase
VINKAVFKDVRFWILLVFVVRLYGITLPPLEVAHNWRQTDGLMIARNFLETDNNIFFPRVDLGGEKSGVVGCEFPILNYLIYLLSSLFGFHDWFGRLIVLIFSSIGVYCFYRLIERFFGRSAAFNSSIILLVSLWFSYARKTIPDAFSVGLTFIGLYHAFRYLYDKKQFSLLYFFLFALLGCLSKILTASLLTVLVIPLFDRSISLKLKTWLSVSSFFILTGVCWWYFIWVPELNERHLFGEHFFMGAGFKAGIESISDNLLLMAKRVFVTPMKYVGLIVFVASVVVVFLRRQKLAAIVFIIPYLSFLVLLTYTGSSVIDDRYYLITVVPVMAFIAGLGMTNINNRMATILLLAIAAENVGDQFHDFRIRQPYKALEELESILDNLSSNNDKIAISSGSPHNPTPMYFAHRKGWAVTNTELLEASYIQYLRANNCKFVVIVKKMYGDISLDLPNKYESEYFKIYAIKSLKE